MRPIYQGFALRWMNGWAFGPDDISNFCAEQNLPTVKRANRKMKIHRIDCVMQGENGHAIAPDRILGRAIEALPTDGGTRRSTGLLI